MVAGRPGVPEEDLAAGIALLWGNDDAADPVTPQPSEIDPQPAQPSAAVSAPVAAAVAPAPVELRGLRPDKKFNVTFNGEIVEGVGIMQSTFQISDLDPSQCYVLLSASDRMARVLWALKHDGEGWKTIVEAHIAKK